MITHIVYHGKMYAHETLHRYIFHITIYVVHGDNSNLLLYKLSNQGLSAMPAPNQEFVPD